MANLCNLEPELKDNRNMHKKVKQKINLCNEHKF